MLQQNLIQNFYRHLDSFSFRMIAFYVILWYYNFQQKEIYLK